MISIVEFPSSGPANVTQVEEEVVEVLAEKKNPPKKKKPSRN